MTESTTPHVLVGTDGSDDSLRAVQYATREANLRGIGLKIVNAVEDAILAGAWGVLYDPTSLQEAGELALEDAAQAAQELGLAPDRISREVVIGSASSVLNRESEHAELVVVGRRAIGGLERIFVGSTSVAVVAGASCPVVMISAATNPLQTGQFKRVLVSIDATDKSDAALRWAFEEAERRHSALTVLHIVPASTLGWAREASTDPGRVDLIVQTAKQAVHERVAALGAEFGGIEVTEQVEFGVPLETIVHASAHADLLIMGTHLSGMPGFALSGVVRGAMAHAACPVGVIRS